MFFGGDDERWSPGHRLKHLILSNKPVAYALTLPRERLQAWDVGQPHRSYAEIRTFYQDLLGAGARASGPFLPALTGTQAEVIAEYSGSIGLLDHDCLYWEEGDIDQYAMLHPVLGLLSVREMLYFTVLHNRHHLSGVEARLERT
ncbi:DinB family protein [Deinococcus sp.]|uniref:DinB family protein n=1 Tax=Deinococcus sp. TaxID=47478 RepID=UPI003C7A6FE3